MLRSALRGLARGTGKMLLSAQRRWRRHGHIAGIRNDLAADHRRCCAGFSAPAPAIEGARRFLAEHFDGFNDLRHHEIYWRITGSLDPAYIPADIYYRTIEPTLNKMLYVPTFTDKNAHYASPLAAHLPEPVLHLVRGDLYLPGFVRIGDNELDDALNDGGDELIVKPTVQHGGGRDMQVMDRRATKDFIKQIMADRRSRSEADWIVQRRLDQCPELARFNPSSVNTYRLMMMTMEREVVCLSSVLRTGRSGMRIDNQAAGGLAGGIEGGRLRGRAIDREFRFYDKHPDSGVAFTGDLPAYQDAVELCRELQRTLPWFDLISWDVAIDDRHQPKIIEFNVAAQEIDFHQMNNGPLFGPADGAVLAAVLRRLAVTPRDPDFAVAATRL